MNKLLVLCCSVLLLVGCGGDEQAKMDAPDKMPKSKQHLVAGMQYLNKQDVPQAIRHFDLAIKEDPTNTENYLLLGQVYMRLKQYERAIDTFSAAIRIDPNNAEAFYMLSVNKMLDGRLENAEKDAQRSVELFMLNRDETKFKRSVALLKTISEAKKGTTSTVE